MDDEAENSVSQGPSWQAAEEWLENELATYDGPAMNGDLDVIEIDSEGEIRSAGNARRQSGNESGSEPLPVIADTHGHYGGRGTFIDVYHQLSARSDRPAHHPRGHPRPRDK